MKSNVPEGITIDMTALLSKGGKDADKAAVGVTCLGYCEYYKGDDGEESCGGLNAVKKGIAGGKIGLAELSHLLDAKPGPARRSGCLINEMCSKCSYVEGDCDFMATSPPADATPCGGYRLLQALLDAGALTPDVVRTLIQNMGR
ncbi:MAG: hypothetical protein PVJ01_04600 [Pseudomonadota bacterium]|jgi:hypothetical protein